MEWIYFYHPGINLKLQLVHLNLLEDQATVPQEALEEDEELPNNIITLIDASKENKLFLKTFDNVYKEVEILSAGHLEL